MTSVFYKLGSDRIKSGWNDAGKTGTALTEPFMDRYGQFWVAVHWDGETDPTNYKRVCLEVEYQLRPYPL